MKLKESKRKPTAEKIASLNTIYHNLRLTFKIPEEQSRKGRYIAVRAAYAKVIRELNFFTLETIGASIRHRENGKVVVKDHATVIHLTRQANNGQYDVFPDYHLALKYTKEMVEEVILPTVDKDTDEYGRLKSGMEITSLRDELRDERIRNKSLEKENKILNSKMRSFKEITLDPIIRRVNTANKRLYALGYEPIPTDVLVRFEKLKEFDYD